MYLTMRLHLSTQMYQAGVRNLNLTFVVKEIAWPVILVLSLCIAIPYVTFMGVFPLLGMWVVYCGILGGVLGDICCGILGDLLGGFSCTG